MRPIIGSSKTTANLNNCYGCITIALIGVNQKKSDDIRNQESDVQHTPLFFSPLINHETEAATVVGLRCAAVNYGVPVSHYSCIESEKFRSP